MNYSNSKEFEVLYAMYSFLFLKQKLKVFNLYKHYDNQIYHRVYEQPLNNEIGTIELKMALARAIVLKNTTS
jgi:hypothetical protein